MIGEEAAARRMDAELRDTTHRARAALRSYRNAASLDLAAASERDLRGRPRMSPAWDPVQVHRKTARKAGRETTIPREH